MGSDSNRTCLSYREHVCSYTFKKNFMYKKVKDKLHFLRAE